MTQYTKSLLMVLVTIATAAVAALSDNRVSQTEAINILLAALGAAIVFAAPNVPGAKYTKLILAALTAAATMLSSFIGAGGIAGVTVAEWIQIGVAALGALGIYTFPNSPPTPAAVRAR